MCEDNSQTINFTSEFVVVHDVLLFLFINIYYYIIIYFSSYLLLRVVVGCYYLII